MKQVEFDTSALISALRGAMLLSRQALQVEIAVGLLVFHTLGDTDVAARKILRGVYASAGRADCLTPDSPSYNTINRRMGRVADFYVTIKPRKLKQILADLTDQPAIDALVAHIAPLQIGSMDDLLRVSGGSRERTVVSEHERRIISTHIKTAHMDIPIPAEMPIGELWELIDKLTEYARVKQEGQSRTIEASAAAGAVH